MYLCITPWRFYKLGKANLGAQNGVCKYNSWTRQGDSWAVTVDSLRGQCSTAFNNLVGRLCSWSCTWASVLGAPVAGARRIREQKMAPQKIIPGPGAQVIHCVDSVHQPLITLLDGYTAAHVPGHRCLAPLQAGEGEAYFFRGAKMGQFRCCWALPGLVCVPWQVFSNHSEEVCDALMTPRVARRGDLGVCGKIILLLSFYPGCHWRAFA
jgi:hypothetical protein